MIGKRLRLARVNQGLKQRELGLLAGVNEETARSRVSQYQRNDVSAPDFRLMCRFANLLDLPEAYSYALDDDLATLILQYHRLKKSPPFNLGDHRPVIRGENQRDFIP